MSLVLSLFPGIGLLDRAFEGEGFCVVRGPDVLWGGDIRNFHPPAGKFDGVIGGPPCQCFSALAMLVRHNGGEPKFGNLIPEFERVVAEAEPAWFLMENVPKAPVPQVPRYEPRTSVLNNLWLPSDGIYGQRQMRTRCFTFSQRDMIAPRLMKYIDLAVFHAPEPTGAVSTAYAGSESKSRVRAVFGDGRPTRKEHRTAAVTSSDGGKSVRMARYTVAEALELQGLPADFLKDAPFTVDGKRRAVANGVPLPMGRAIAKAIKEATKPKLRPQQASASETTKVTSL